MGLNITKEQYYKDRDRAYRKYGRSNKRTQPEGRYYDNDSYEKGKEMDDLYGFSMMDWGCN